MKIGYTCGSSSDATSLYQMVIPFQHIEASFLMDFIKIKEIGWNTLGGLDRYIIQRPYTKSHIEVLKKLKALNIPTIIDFDDDLTNIPVYNHAYEIYKDPQVKINILKCIELADKVIVSTDVTIEEQNVVIEEILSCRNL